jgi:HSP20 family molecular chaperone IbpA
MALMRFDPFRELDRLTDQALARRRPIRQEGDEVIVDERPQGEFRRQLFLGDNVDPKQDDRCM